MLGSVVLDVAIGMAFVYLLLSLIASVVQEILAAFLQLRPANLQRGLCSLFSGDSLWGANLVDTIYNHGLVRGLYMDPGRDPVQTAMDSVNVAQAESDVAVRTQATAQAAVDALASHAAPDSALAEAAAATLTAAVAIAEAAVAKLKASQQVLKSLTEPQEKSKREQLVDKVREAMRKWIGVQPEITMSGVSSSAVLPSYIPSRTFALALIDILNKTKATGPEAMAAITKSLADHYWLYQRNRAGEALYALAVSAKGDLDAFQAKIEDWYNDGMDRVSGWYKRNIQRILLVIGMVLAILFNVDSVRVARTLWSDREVRQAMVATAGDYVKNHPAAKSETQAGSKQVNLPAPQSAPVASADASITKGVASAKPATEADLVQQLSVTASAFNDVTKSTLLPVGWNSHSWDDYEQFGTGLWRFLGLLTGWAVTAAAVSLGAPFWFDTLNRFMVVRSTIKPQEKSQVEGSKDKAN